MFKHLQFAAFAVLLSAGFAACSDDEETVDPVTPPTEEEEKPVTPESPESQDAYAVIQGNMYGGIMGSIDGLNFETGAVTSNIFYTTVGQALGDTPQAAVCHGENIYIPVYASNLVWVVNATTLKPVAQIQTPEPEAVCGVGDYVFVANNTGALTRIDTSDFSTATLENVGPNPAGLTVAGGKVYVTISDGYNYANGYANGKKVVAVNPETLTAEATYTVGTNPGQICANTKGEVFLVARGNYYDLLPTVQKIATDGTVTDYAAGSLIAMQDDRLYVLDVTADYTTNAATVTATAYNTADDTHTPLQFATDNAPAMPQALDVNPENGRLFVCSDKGPMDYDKTGYVYEYTENGTAADGSGATVLDLVHRYDVGIHPYGVVFK